MTTEQYLTFIKWILVLQGILCTTMLFRYFDTRPDKETRKRIRELARENNLMQHVVVNRILKSYFVAYDKALSKQIRIDDSNKSFEEWKATREKKHIVKPKKKHPKE